MKEPRSPIPLIDRMIREHAKRRRQLRRLLMLRADDVRDIQDRATAVRSARLAAARKEAPVA